MSLTSRSTKVVLESLDWENSQTLPLTLQQLKDWMRVEVSQDDSIITGLLDECIDLTERKFNFSIIDKTVTTLWSSFDGVVRLPMSPVKEITSIEVDEEEISDYSLTGRSLTVNAGGSVLKVVYTAGWEKVPNGILLGLKKMILSNSEDRQDLVGGMAVSYIPGNSQALFKRYMRF